MTLDQRPLTAVAPALALLPCDPGKVMVCTWIVSFPTVPMAQFVPPGLCGGPSHPCSSEGNPSGLCCPLSHPTPAPPLVPIGHGPSWHGT